MHLSLLLQHMLDRHSMKPIQTCNCCCSKAVLPFPELFLMVFLCGVQILHWGTTFYRNLLSPTWNCTCPNVCACGDTNYMHHVVIVLSGPSFSSGGERWWRCNSTQHMNIRCEQTQHVTEKRCKCRKQLHQALYLIGCSLDGLMLAAPSVTM